MPPLLTCTRIVLSTATVLDRIVHGMKSRYITLTLPLHLPLYHKAPHGQQLVVHSDLLMNGSQPQESSHRESSHGYATLNPAFTNRGLQHHQAPAAPTPTPALTPTPTQTDTHTHAHTHTHTHTQTNTHSAYV